MKVKQRGFTLIELVMVIGMIMIVVVVFIAGLYGTVIKGNFWYTEEGVERALRVDRPKVQRVLKTTRNLWAYSEVMVEEEGQRKTYYLDTDLLWNYEFHDKKDD